MAVFQVTVMWKISVDVCLDNSFCTAEPFITKLDMVIHYHQLGCHAKKERLLYSRSRSQLGTIKTRYDYFCLIF